MSVFKGLLASLILLVIYFLVITLISGWSYAWEQFAKFWYYILLLVAGFGVQVGLYSYLKGEKQVLATTGTTSTAAMISCCAHYLTNILPILGVTGIVVFINQYQVQFFWVGIFFNLLGITYMGNKVLLLSKKQ